MRALEWLVDLADQVGVKLGWPPGSRRWEEITAVLGWSAILALVAWFVASLAGFPDIAGYALGVVAFAFGIALKRDVLRLLRLIATGRQGD